MGGVFKIIFMSKRERGRPPVLTPENISKLKQAFLWGAVDEEACSFAGIGKTAFYEYKSKNKDFAEEIDGWKQNPVLKAKKSVVEALEKNPDLALRYLERKCKNEFSLRQEADVNLKGSVTLEITSDHASKVLTAADK